MLAHRLSASYVNQKPGYGATLGSVEGSNELRDEKLYEFK